MTEPKFDELWKEIRNVAEDIVNSCMGGISFDEKKKDYIHYEYDKFRAACRVQHLRGSAPSKGKDIEGILLDRHKVAACISGAILSAKPLGIHFADDKAHLKLSYLANETLALFSALGIVKSFIRSDKDNVINLDEELKEDFLRCGFVFPTPPKDDYLPWLLFLLQESSQIGFNVLSLSNILYLLETYTFSQLKISRLEK